MSEMSMPNDYEEATPIDGADTMPALASRSLLAGDPHRPRYHFLPPSNWMNDPNGLIQWKGRFHLFYQYNPFAAEWGNIHWGHAISDDLVHWRDLPIALAPTPGTVDEYGVFSGCALDADGVATVLYTGVRKPPDSPPIERPCLARSKDDDLVNWEKYRGNPVIDSPPRGVDLVGFRDHGVWREDGSWYQVIGSGIRGVGGDGVRVSIQGVVDDGGYFYAPQSFMDSMGRRVMFGWVWEGRDQRAQVAAGWAGVMSLPRVLLPRSDAHLGVQPAAELESLRGPHTRLAHLSISAHSTSPLEVRGAALEILARFTPGQAERIGLKVRCSPDRTEQTLIAYEPARAWLSVDREHSSLDESVHREPHGTVVRLGDGENLRLHVFLDHSMIEVFANDKVCLTTRVYPSRSDSLGVELFAEGGAAELEHLDAWDMRSIWAPHA